MTVENPKPKQLLRPITTGANRAMNQSQFLAITCNSLEAGEKSSVHGAIGFRFASHWLKNWRESFKPITKRSNRNHVITFDSHLKTAPIMIVICGYMKFMYLKRGLTRTFSIWSSQLWKPLKQTWERDWNFSGLSRRCSSVHDCKYHTPKVSSLYRCLPIFFFHRFRTNRSWYNEQFAERSRSYWKSKRQSKFSVCCI